MLDTERSLCLQAGRTEYFYIQKLKRGVYVTSDLMLADRRRALVRQLFNHLPSDRLSSSQVSLFERFTLNVLAQMLLKLIQPFFYFPYRLHELKFPSDSRLFRGY